MRLAWTFALAWMLSCGAGTDEEHAGGSGGGAGGVDGVGGRAAGGTAGQVSTGGGANGGAGGGGPGTCDFFCSRVAGSGCSGAGTLPECLDGCRASLGGSCASSLQTLLDCTAVRPVTACNALGIVYFTDCQGEQAAYVTCEGG